MPVARLDHYGKVADKALECEATQLAAIFSTIIRNMRLRLEREASERKEKLRRKP
jgi:hypothetical protein